MDDITLAFSSGSHAAKTRIEKLLGLLRFEPEGEAGFAIASATLITITTAYLYFTGWVYAYFFYKDFGVSLVSLDMPLQYFFAYSFTPLATPAGVFLIFGIVAMILLHASKKVGTPLVSCAMLLVFPILFVIGTSTAHDRSTERRTNHHLKVQLLPKHQEAALVHTDLVNPNIVHDMRREEFQLLFETKDRIIVFYQPACIGGALPDPHVLSIMRTDLEWSMVNAQ